MTNQPYPGQPTCPDCGGTMYPERCVWGRGGKEGDSYRCDKCKANWRADYWAIWAKPREAADAS